MEKMIIFYRNATEQEIANSLADKYIPYADCISTSSDKRILIDEKNKHTVEVKLFKNESSARGLRADFVLIPKDHDLLTSCFNVFIGITRGSQDALMFYSDGRD